jgi:amino acid transporter
MRCQEGLSCIGFNEIWGLSDSIVGFIVFPIIWSIHEALVTTKMGTMFPKSGGYVVWVSSSFGPF